MITKIHPTKKYMQKLEKDNIINKRYVLEAQIGTGGFSEVWKAFDAETQTEVALKIFAPKDGLDNDGIKIFRNEYKKVHDLLHSNILIARHFDVYNNSPFLVMPYCQGSLYSLIADEKQFTEIQLTEIVFQISKALKYLHEEKLLHQDIKPHNILIYNSKKYVLADFGVSSRLRQTIAQSAMGRNRDSVYFTPLYSPPDMYLPSLPQPEKDDIFALGITMYELACKKLPMMSFARIAKEGYPIPVIPDRFSSDFQKLIFRCLTRERKARPSAKMLAGWAEFYLENGYWRIPDKTAEIEERRSTEVIAVPDYIKDLEEKPDAKEHDTDHRNTEYISNKQVHEEESRNTDFIYNKPPVKEEQPIMDNRRHREEPPPVRREEYKPPVFEEKKPAFNKYEEQQEKLKKEVKQRVEQGKDSLKNFADSVEDLRKNRSKKKASKWRFIIPIAVLLLAGAYLYWGVSTYEKPNIWGDDLITTQVPEKWHSLLEAYYEGLDDKYTGFQLFATENTGQFWQELEVISNDGKSSETVLACMLCNAKNSVQQKRGSLHVLSDEGKQLETVSSSFPMRFSRCEIINKADGVAKLACKKPLDYSTKWQYLEVGNTLIYKYGSETSHCFTD
ncbi:MAG: protein kinase domain-containing protein [Chitinophagales bacterium]